MQMDFCVAIHFEDDYGFIKYHVETKQVMIVLNNEVKKQEILEFLNSELSVNLPNDTLMDFSAKVVEPLASLADLKIALTRLWDNTGVLVDWSRPVEC